MRPSKKIKFKRIVSLSLSTLACLEHLDLARYKLRRKAQTDTNYYFLDSLMNKKSTIRLYFLKKEFHYKLFL